MASFTERLRGAIGPRGYDQAMRRSIQSCVLYEAYRVLATKLPAMRPFQRKIAFWDMANYLVQTTDLLDHQKTEIMWRTATSKEPLQPDTAWKRGKNIEKELSSIVQQIQPFLDGRSHDEACHALIQHEWEEGNADHKGKPFPETFQFSHNNCLLCYRMFYRGSDLSPDLPPPVPPKPVLVPQQRPPKDASTTIILAPATASAERAMAQSAQDAAVAAATAQATRDHDLNEAELEAIVQGTEAPAEMDGRRSTLQEVRQHLELLKEFEGVISQEELNNRKRQLYMALPPAPPPHAAGETSTQHGTPKRARGPDKASV